MFSYSSVCVRHLVIFWSFLSVISDTPDEVLVFFLGIRELFMIIARSAELTIIISTGALSLSYNTALIGEASEYAFISFLRFDLVS